MMKHVIYLFAAVMFIILSCCVASACCPCCHNCPLWNQPEPKKAAYGEALVVIRMTDEEKQLAAASRDEFDKRIRARAERAAKSAGAEVVSVMNELSASSGKILAHIRTSTGTTEELIDKLKKNPDVLSAEPNRITSAPKVQAAPES